MKTIEEKLEALRAMLQAQQFARLAGEGLNVEQHRLNYIASVKLGSKYAKVDLGGSGLYMVDVNTGEIFGVKAYGVINRSHRYGTLDTINSFNWGFYKAIRRDA